MGKGKDLTEKMLEEYNDVFADIVNGIVFEGRPVIRPEELQNTKLESMYRSIGSGSIRSQERDVAKIWKKNGIRIALCGLENQTKIDKYMPLRVMGYEGASYRDMLKNGDIDVFPVVTLVLYFGDEHWQSPKSIKELLADKPYPIEMTPYLNDARANICEVAFLSEKEINRFHGDFRIVANFFAGKRKDPDYTPGDEQVIEHVEDVLWLLTEVTGDDRYHDICYEKNFQEVHTMCDVAQRLEDRGRASGLQEGIREGKKEGIKEGGLIMLYRLASDCILTVDQAVTAAQPYGIKDAEDFRNRALVAGFHLK